MGGHREGKGPMVAVLALTWILPLLRGSCRLHYHYTLAMSLNIKSPHCFSASRRPQQDSVLRWPQCPGQHSPRRSMVSLILLAAFSLRSPGWLLLMENRVMTPKHTENSGISRTEDTLLGVGAGDTAREAPWHWSPMTNYTHPDLKLGEAENERTVISKCDVGCGNWDRA